MVQMKFLWALRSLNHNCKIQQLDNGAVICHLTDDIDILHESRKNDQMTLIFTETNKKYLITSDSKFRELTERFENSFSTGATGTALRNFAKDNLEEITEEDK